SRRRAAESYTALFGELRERTCLLVLERDRLLRVDVLAGLEAGGGYLCVRPRGRQVDDRVDFRVGEELVERRAVGGAELLRQRFRALRHDVRHRRERQP